MVKVKLLEFNKILSIKFLESWGPKGIVGINRERRYRTHLALLVLIGPKGGLIIRGSTGLTGAKIDQGIATTGLIGAGVIICGSTGLIGAGVICGSTGLIGAAKGIVGINRELRDCLRVGAFPIYGNGGFIVDISKGARMYSCLVNRKRSGVRPLSDTSQTGLSLTRKLTKVINIKGARMYSSLVTLEPQIKLDHN